jgi:hypothetical protein
MAVKLLIKNIYLNNHFIATVFNGDNVALIPQFINDQWVM